PWNIFLVDHSSRTPSPPSECAHCGAAIPRNAKACPGCGADERTGWRETSLYDGLDLPESAWTGDDDRPADRSTPRVNGIPWYWWCVGAVLAAFLIAGLIGLG